MAATRIIQMALAGEEIDLQNATKRPGPPRFKAPRGFVEDAEILDDTSVRMERKSRRKSAHRRSLKDTLAALRHGKESILPGMQMPGMRKPGLALHRPYRKVRATKAAILPVPTGRGTTGSMSPPRLTARRPGLSSCSTAARRTRTISQPARA